MGYAYRVESELYVVGKTEEGYDYTAEGYYVVAESPEGKCYSKGWFPGCKSEDVDDEDFGSFTYFKDIREEAEAGAEALLVKSSKEDPTKADGWNFLRNAYGSEAYGY